MARSEEKIRQKKFNKKVTLEVLNNKRLLSDLNINLRFEPEKKRRFKKGVD